MAATRYGRIRIRSGVTTASISVAERVIASRLRQEIDSDERIALKDALKALQKLIVETTSSEEVAENAKGVA